MTNLLNSPLRGFREGLFDFGLPNLAGSRLRHQVFENVLMQVQVALDVKIKEVVTALGPVIDLSF